MNIMGTGIAGIQRGMDAFQSAATNIANSGQAPQGVDAAGLTQNLVSMQQSKVMVEASIKVVEAGSSTMGSLLDIQA